jgi:amino acid permease
MKLRDAILLSLSVALLIIGIHQTMVLGFQKAYWAIMLAIVFFFFYTLKKGKDAEPQDEENVTGSRKKGKQSSVPKKPKRS